MRKRKAQSWSRDVITRKEWAWGVDQALTTHSAAHGPAELAPLGSLVEMQSLRPISDLLSQGLHFGAMVCEHMTVCTDLEERRAVLLRTRMVKPRWLQRWLFCQRLFRSTFYSLIAKADWVPDSLSTNRHFPITSQMGRSHWSEGPRIAI